jgi:hypothetical protein
MACAQFAIDADRRGAPMNTRLISIAAAIALAACATKADDAAPLTYKVLKADAQIPFGSSQVYGFSVGDDDSLILQGPGRRFYRATLDTFCANRLPWELAIGFPDEGMSRIDRFSSVIIDGQRCRFLSFDEIEDPKKTAEAAAAATEEAPVN